MLSPVPAGTDWKFHRWAAVTMVAWWMNVFGSTGNVCHDEMERCGCTWAKHFVIPA